MIELFQMLCTQELQLCGPQRFRYSVVAGEEKLIEDLQINLELAVLALARIMCANIHSQNGTAILAQELLSRK